MKKLFKSLLLMCFFSLLLAGCNSKEKNPSNDGQNKSINIDFLEDYIVDLSDATALGIAKEVPQQVATLSNSHSNKSDQIHYFVKQKCDNNNCHIEKVKFIKDNEMLSQDDLSVQVNRLYVGREFTFIQFASILEFPDGHIEDYRNLYAKDEWHSQFLTKTENGYSIYDTSDYLDDDHHKTFIIENNTGKIFPLSNSIQLFDIEGDLIIARNIIAETNSIELCVYNLYINEEGNLIFENIFNNPNAELISTYKDKFSNIYIRTDSINYFDEEKNIHYYTGNRYFFDYSSKDNYVLKNDSPSVDVTSSCFICNIDNGNITFVGENFSELSIDSDYTGINVTPRSRFYNETLSFISDKKMWTSMHKSDGSATFEDVRFRSYINVLGEYIKIEEPTILPIMFLEKRFIIYMDNDKLMYFDGLSPIEYELSESGYRYQKKILSENTTYLYNPDDSLSVGNKYLFAHNTPTGSVKFTIDIDEITGFPKIVEISNENYKKNDIILFPIK